MHLSDFNMGSMAIRHLVAVYGVILGVQAGYFAWIALSWRKLDRKKSS